MNKLGNAVADDMTSPIPARLSATKDRLMTIGNNLERLLGGLTRCEAPPPEPAAKDSIICILDQTEAITSELAHVENLVSKIQLIIEG